MPRGPAGGHVHVLPLQAPQVWRSPCPLHPADSQFLCSWFALWDDKACVWTRGSGTLVFRSWGTSGQGLSLPSCSADPRLCSAVGGREGSTAMEEMSGARQDSASSSYNPCRVEKLPELEPGCAGSGAGQGWSLGGLPLVRQAGPHRETGGGGLSQARCGRTLRAALPCLGQRPAHPHFGPPPSNSSSVCLQDTPLPSYLPELLLGPLDQCFSAEAIRPQGLWRCFGSEVKDCYWHLLGEARDVIKHPAMQSKPPHPQKESSPHPKRQ